MKCDVCSADNYTYEDTFADDNGEVITLTQDSVKVCMDKSWDDPWHPVMECKECHSKHPPREEE